MFWPDVEQLRKFYKSPLGGLACRRIRGRIHDLWPEVGSGARLPKPEYIAGIGYAPPYLLPMDNQNEENNSSYRLFCIMPAAQGAIYWPKGKKNRTLLSREKELPLEDESLDRVLLIHTLEYCENVREFMREVWRVLKPGGKLVVVVPNRRGMWSNAEHTPFGHGKPYSTLQIEELFVETLFLPGKVETTLFMPPFKTNYFLKISTFFEPLTWQIVSPFGGIVIAEAEKQLYAANVEGVRKGGRNFVTAID